MSETQHAHGPHARRERSHSNGAHGWMMIACCIPMLVIAITLVATGVAGVGFIVFALMCTLMMTLMMRGGHGREGKEK